MLILLKSGSLLYDDHDLKHSSLGRYLVDFYLFLDPPWPNMFFKLWLSVS